MESLIMLVRFTILILLIVFPVASGSPAAACEAVGGHACIMNEDSHPHEVLPGQQASFQVETSDVGQRILVRCTLSGPVSSVGILFSNLTPQGWAGDNLNPALDTPIDVEIEGITTSLDDVGFAFVNHDSRRLLWHECYNR